MINRIHKFIQKEDLLKPDDKIILAVSGGIDSMCLLDIFHQLPYSIAVAHINHQLRGADADEDQLFIRGVCKQLSIPFYSISIDIKGIALKAKANISNTGRIERYKFFNQICKDNGYTKIATAHHADDDIETLLMRLLDGSGLKGLTGIPIKNGNIIRPMLTLTREEIEHYATEQSIAYREDASNANETYLRNAIRHQLIPKLTELKPSSQSGLRQSIHILKDSHALLMTLLQSELQHRITESDNSIIIDIPSKELPGRVSLLYYCLEPYGYTRSQIVDITETTQSGATFNSEHYQGIINRGKLILSKYPALGVLQKPTEITAYGNYVLSSLGSLSVMISDTKTYDSNQYSEIIDADKIDFPLTIRHWRQGDRFSPLGMHGQTQSLQDFFTNAKLSVFEKEQVLLIESKGQIIWVIGHRVAHQVKVTDDTKRFLKLDFTSS